MTEPQQQVSVTPTVAEDETQGRRKMREFTDDFSVRKIDTTVWEVIR